MNDKFVISVALVGIGVAILVADIALNQNNFILYLSGGLSGFVIGRLLAIWNKK